MAFNVGGGLQTFFAPDDMAFSATFDDTAAAPDAPEPGTLWLLAGAVAIGFGAKRKFARS